MVDGAATLMTIFYGMRASEIWTEERQDNFLDGRAQFYDKYETKDGKYICVGSIEPQFYKLLLKKTGLESDPNFSVQMDRKKWPVCKAKVREVFKTKTRGKEFPGRVQT